MLLVLFLYNHLSFEILKYNFTKLPVAPKGKKSSMKNKNYWNVASPLRGPHPLSFPISWARVPKPELAASLAFQ